MRGQGRGRGRLCRQIDTDPGVTPFYPAQRNVRARSRRWLRDVVGVGWEGQVVAAGFRGGERARCGGGVALAAMALASRRSDDFVKCLLVQFDP